MIYTLENDVLKIQIDSHGAEIKSVVNKSTGMEYMWCGDSKFWGRTSPVLFPIVGSVKDKRYKYNGRTFFMGQHGFARDMEHMVLTQSTDEIWFMLYESDETLIIYPFTFMLNIGYKLIGNEVKIMWKITNPSTERLYFSIGAHPAFNCPLDGDDKSGYKLYFGTASDCVYYRGLNTDTGLALNESRELHLDNGYLQLTDGIFDRSAMIFENSRVGVVALVDKNGNKYVTVEFDTPLFGIWSPEGKNAPFVCIEPWYGRCDAEDFEGSFEDREYSNLLEPGGKFEREYKIIYN